MAVREGAVGGSRFSSAGTQRQDRVQSDVTATPNQQCPPYTSRRTSNGIIVLAFAIYLTYVEAYVLDTWCVLCLSSLALIATITFLAGVVQARARAPRVEN